MLPEKILPIFNVSEIPFVRMPFLEIVRVSIENDFTAMIQD